MISVVIPTHNRLDDLKIALQSVYNQTVLPYEIIVVDDGSKVEVTNSIFEESPNEIKTLLVRNELSKGGNFTRNRGVKESSGEYIAFLDDDDEFLPTKIEVLVKEIGRNQDIDLFYHSAEINMVNENQVYYSKPKSFDNKEEAFHQILLENFIGGTPMVICKRATLLEIGLFDESMPSLQDYELWIRFLEKKKSIKYIDIPLTKYHHITNGNSITKSIDKYFISIDMIESKYANYYKKLSKEDINFRDEKKQIVVTEKHLLSRNKNKAQICFLTLFKEYKKLKYLFAYVVLFFGIDFFYKVKSKLK